MSDFHENTHKEYLFKLIIKTKLALLQMWQTDHLSLNGSVVAVVARSPIYVDITVGILMRSLGIVKSFSSPGY